MSSTTPGPQDIETGFEGKEIGSSGSETANRGPLSASPSRSIEKAPSPISDEFSDNSRVPHLPLISLFWKFFYQFGCFAWGGPVAQIALIKEILVEKEQWITIARFQRVFGVYQIVPGPEAAELCMYFGCLSRGRVGGLVAGLGFVMPGFLLMILASWAYELVGFRNAQFNASFRAIQPIVAAMILKAVHKLAEHTFPDPVTKRVNYWLVAAAIFTAINTALHINIFISLFLYGLINVFISRRLWIPAGLLFAAQYITFGIYCHFRGLPSPLSLALGIAKVPDLPHLFLLGIVAGSLSFGGAYTAIPFVQVEAVILGAWIPQSVFIDCIAIGNLLPAPLVIFITFIGYQGGLIWGEGQVGYALAGAVVATVGMLFPCFVFTIMGHDVLERIVRYHLLTPFLDGLVGSVIGIIAIVAMQILQGAIVNTRSLNPPTTTKYNITTEVWENNVTLHQLPKPINHEQSLAILGAAQSAISAVLYFLALIALYRFASNKYASILLVICAAVAGQFLFL
ncbi:chromate transporter-domain-containing protein [Peziza echinospora]|nr:chromate transporter-domain-containing protein [Peziza echinospora]